jgi:hypothetical protein
MREVPDSQWGGDPRHRCRTSLRERGKGSGVGHIFTGKFRWRMEMVQFPEAAGFVTSVKQESVAAAG